MTEHILTLGSYINDVTQTWTFFEFPTNSITLKWLFYLHPYPSVTKGLTSLPSAVYFDQLLGARSTQKLVKSWSKYTIALYLCDVINECFLEAVYGLSFDYSSDQIVGL